MFAKSFISLITVLAASAPAFSKPITARQSSDSSLSSSSYGSGYTYQPTSYSSNGYGYSLDGYGGYSSLSNFDGFYGSQNFDGSHNSQTVIEQNVVCQSESVEIVQQRLAILIELMKRVVTEQICEVEVQTIVVQQFSSSFESFGDDISRRSGRHVGFDSGVANRIGQLFGSNGDLTSNDLGFSGSSIGSQTVVPSGNNWVDATSPQSQFAAENAAQAASFFS